MKTYLAFYKGKKQDNPSATLIDQAICFIDGGKYSHAELVLSIDANGIGDCISSSIRDGGVRRKNIYLLNDKWELIPAPQIDVQVALQVYELYKDAGYDCIGLGSTVFKWFPNIPSLLFCIEFLMKMATMPDAETWGVNRCYEYAIKNSTN